jgi:hypothetical protein
MTAASNAITMMSPIGPMTQAETASGIRGDYATTRREATLASLLDSRLAPPPCSFPVRPNASEEVR